MFECPLKNLKSKFNEILGIEFKEKVLIEENNKVNELKSWLHEEEEDTLDSF